MEKYLKGEEQHRVTTVDVEKKLVTIKNVTKLDNNEQWYLETKMDLSGESMDDILANAGMNYLIQVIRPKYIKVRKAKDIDETKVHRPGDYPSGRGTGVQSPVTATKNFLVHVLGKTKEEVEKMTSKEMETVLNKHFNK